MMACLFSSGFEAGVVARFARLLFDDAAEEDVEEEDGEDEEF